MASVLANLNLLPGNMTKRLIEQAERAMSQQG